MKQIYHNTLNELQKSYTNLSIALISIAAAFSFFTKFQIFEHNLAKTILHFLFFASSAAGLMAILLVSLVYLEEYFQTTKLAKYSIARIFVKNANHALVNVKTLLILISIVYAIIALTTNQVFAASIIFWFITSISLMFA